MSSPSNRSSDAPSPRAEAAFARKPYLRLHLLEESDPNTPSADAAGELQIVTAQNGSPIAARMDPKTSELRHLASRHDPDREAERCLARAKAESWRGTEVILILGLANPVLLEKVSGHLHENQVCVAVDADPGLGRLLCRNFDAAATYLERPGCHLFCDGVTLERLWAYLETIPIERLSGVRVIHHEPSLRRAPQFFVEIEERARRILQAKMSDLLTRFEFEKNWLGNILINARLLPAPDASAGQEKDPGAGPPGLIRAHAGALAGIPGVLVAAGPSLRDSLELLRKLRSRAFILCCDTATKVLLRAGIQPHAVVTLDAQKHTLFHFLGEDLSKILLFADIVTHPLVLRSLRPRGLIFSTTAKYIETASGANTREATIGTEFVEARSGPLGDIQSGGSVATTGYEILRYLGVDSILLVGQDLAYTGREIHCTGTHHNERWLGDLSRVKSLEFINEAVVRKRTTSIVEALDGGTVLSDYVLNLYRHWFEDAIPRGGVPVINLTARGARIAGADHPSDAAALVQALPERAGIDAIFADAPSMALSGPTSTLTDTPLARAVAELYGELRRLLALPEEELLKSAEELFESYGFLRTLNRRVNVYVNRHRSTLDAERAEKLRLENTRKIFTDLERALRPYYSPADF